jgi:Skp family chaperone for outer membrane proteins
MVERIGRWRKALGIAALAAGLLAPVVPGAAQELPPAVVAVIDYQKILSDSAAAKSIRDQVAIRRESYQGEIGASEQRLREEERTLAKQRSVLSAEAFAAKRKEFEDEVAEAQRIVQERRRILEESSDQAFDQLRATLFEIVAGLAESRGFNLVLPNSDVLFFAREIDLTDEVMAELDRRLPEVPVNFAAAP